MYVPEGGGLPAISGASAPAPPPCGLHHAMPDASEATSGDLPDLARLLSQGAGPIADRILATHGFCSDAELHQIVFEVLEAATQPFGDVHVRADRPPGNARGRGSGWAWRFNLIIECPDRVLAAVEITSGAQDLERQAFASARLSLGLTRGIAERGFLIALSPEGDGLVAHSPASTARAHPELPAVISVSLAGVQWVLAITEASRSA